MTSVLIVNLPKMLGNYLPAAPALLKGACNHLRVSSKVLDFNLDLLSECDKQKISINESIVGITEDTIKDEKLKKIVDALLTKWTSEIISHNPKVLAVSVFSYYGRYFAKQLFLRLNLDCKIIIGGAGLKDSINGIPEFAINLKKLDLIDDYIVDDGELAFPELVAQYLKCNYTPINETLDIPYYPDYSDYKLETYQTYTTEQIYVPITGSRGCVRACNFCEIHNHWKFKQRSAEHIASELKAVLQSIVNPHFHFTDSLVNGSLKEFTKLLDILVDLQQEYKFSWGGQFIIREPEQFGEVYWQKLGLSNAQRLEIGVETGSEVLRYNMDKPFTNSALEYSLAMMEKYSIKCVLLFFIGHPLETDNDFNATLELLEKYKDNTVIDSLQFGFAMAVMPNTPLSTNKKDYGLTVTKNPTIWFTTQNPTLSYSKRLERRKQISARALELGYTLSFDNELAINEMEYNQNTFKNELKIIEKLVKA